MLPSDKMNALSPELQALVKQEVERQLRNLAAQGSETMVLSDDLLPAIGQLGPAPRALPFSVALYLRLCSCAIPWLGWFFAGFGLMFALIAVAVGLDDSIPRIWIDAGEGTITSIEKTTATVNEQEIYAYHFETTGLDSETMSGVSYGFQGKYDTDDNVPLQRAGTRYRIQGLTITPVGWGGPLVFFGIGLLFAAIGLCFPIYSWFAGGKAIRLLQDGTATGARFLACNPTGMSVNDQAVMKVDFEYQVDGQAYTTSAQALDTSRLTDKMSKVVLYDPVQPARSVVLEGLPSGLELDEWSGRFSVSPRHCMLPLLGATIVGGQFIAIIVLTILAF